MNEILADTHTILWSLFEPVKLSQTAHQVLQTATSAQKLYISAITIVEVTYLLEKKSIPYLSALVDLLSLVNDPALPLQVFPINVDVASVIGRVVRAEVPDMPDRIIAATAIAHRLTLLTKDQKLHASTSLRPQITVVW